MYDPSQAPKKSQVRTKKNPEWRTEADYKEDKKAYIKFTKNLHLGEVYVEREFIQDYSSDYTAYNGTWFRDQLTEEECCIYNCYLYAMENGFTGFTLYVQDNDRDSGISGKWSAWCPRSWSRIQTGWHWEKRNSEMPRIISAKASGFMFRSFLQTAGN